MGSVRKRNAPEQERAESVAHMEALGSEFQVAIRAIAANDASALEESVQRQMESAARLRAALHGPSPGRALPQTAAASQGGTAGFARAARDLSRAAEEYAAVLDHSGKTLRMLQALHGESPAVGTGVHVQRAVGRPGWSWEV